MSPQHLRQFNAVLLDPRLTGNEAHAWITKLGYQIGRTAVFNYRRHLRSQAFAWRCPLPPRGDDGTARKQITATAAQLKGDALTALFHFSEFLRLAAATGRPTPAALTGLIAVPSTEAVAKGVSKVR